MKLLRAATIYFSPPPAGWEGWTMTQGRCVVSTMSVRGSPAPEGQMRMLVTAQVDLAELPGVDTEALITPPEALRKECEAGIEAAAAIISVLSGSARNISSPFPPLALVPESDSERAFLAAARGFRSHSRAPSRARYAVPLSPRVVEALGDRLAGVILLADLCAQAHAIARYREALRFLELAFALPASQLEKKLAQFLAPTDAGYTREEVARWLSLRHAAVHADRPGGGGLAGC